MYVGGRSTVFDSRFRWAYRLRQAGGVLGKPAGDESRLFSCLDAPVVLNLDVRESVRAFTRLKPTTHCVDNKPCDAGSVSPRSSKLFLMGESEIANMT